MSSQGTRRNRQAELERPLGARPTPQANAEVLLAELKRLLESSGHPPFAPSPSPAPPLSASTVFASASTFAKPRQSTDFDKTDGADDLSADGSLKRSQAAPCDTYGQHQDLTKEATHLRSRRWRLAASGLALGFAALAGAGLALKPAAPGSKSPLSVVPMQAQSDVQPRSAESVVTSSDVGGPLIKDNPLPEHMEVGSREAVINAQESTAKTSAANDTQRPADRLNAVAVATPALASAAAGSALTVSPTARHEPERKVFVGPDGAPIATRSSNSVNSTSPSEGPKSQTEAAKTAVVRVDSARLSATKIDLSARPIASKKSVRKIVAKSGKATAGAMAEAPKQPLSLAQPEKAVKSPTAQAATDQVAATPTAPTTFAAQSVGQLTHAFVYLTHLPVALIQHPTDTNTEAK